MRKEKFSSCRLANGIVFLMHYKNSFAFFIASGDCVSEMFLSLVRKKSLLC